MLQKIQKNIKNRANAIALIILAAMFFLMLGSSSGDSLTRDELAHIGAGYSYLTQQDYRLNPEHPPLIKDLAALPLLFLKPKFPIDSAAWTQDINGQWSLGDTFLFKIGNDADKIIFWARVPMMLIALLLGYYIFRFARELAGETAALGALAFYAFSPNIIAHSRLVTTDMGIAFFALVSFYYFWNYLKNPTWKNLAAASVVFGLTHLAKFSSPLLFPAFGLMAVMASFDPRPSGKDEIEFPFSDRWKRASLKKFHNYLAGFILITVIAYAIVGVVYSFHIWRMPVSAQHQLINDAIHDSDSSFYKSVRGALNWMADKPVLRYYSQYALGFFMVYSHSAGGHSTYFMNEMGNNWWDYYLVAYLIKEPIPSQLLFYLALFAAGWLWLKQATWERGKTLKKTLAMNFENFLNWTGKHYLEVGMIAFIALVVIIGSKSKLQLGIRYILLVFPLLYILIMVSLKRFMEAQTNKHLLPFYLTLFAFLMVWVFIESLGIYPSYLAYYNEFIGGPKNGYKYLVDSNTDWGQDLKRLAAFVDENKIDKIKVDYFGGADPKYYLGDKLIIWGYDKGPTTGWLAVGSSALQWNRGIPADKKIKPPEYNYHWLDKHEPVAQIGYSIFVYKIE